MKYELIHIYTKSNKKTIAFLKAGKKYIVAFGYDERYGCWGSGHYFDNLIDGLETFTKACKE